jgi:hypothetical protein
MIRPSALGAVGPWKRRGAGVRSARQSQLATGTFAMPPVLSQNDAVEPLVTSVIGAQRMLDAGHQKI